MAQQQEIDGSIWTAIVSPRGKIEVAWFSKYTGGRHVHMNGKIYKEDGLRAAGYTFVPLVAMTRDLMAILTEVLDFAMDGYQDRELQEPESFETLRQLLSQLEEQPHATDRD